MNLTGSLAGPLGTILNTVYGSYDGAGGIGSSFVDTLVNLPRMLTEMTVGLMAAAGADLGSTIGP